MAKEKVKKRIQYQGISTLEVLEEAKNYNNWIAQEIVSHISAPVLEVGAGTGNLTVHFLSKIPFYITDKDTGLVANLKKRLTESKDITIEVLDVTSSPPKKFLSFFSSIFAVNVLEHIQSDEDALRNIYKILKPGGKLILLVPAKKFAYTKLDRELGHVRRYEKKELIKKLQKKGYSIEKIYYFNIVGLLSWIVRDKVNRENIHLKPYHIRIFDSIVPFLSCIESIIPIPVGISLIVVAKKI